MSATECSASASIAALPEIAAAANFAIAIAKFAASAASTLLRGSFALPPSLTLPAYPRTSYHERN